MLLGAVVVVLLPLTAPPSRSRGRRRIRLRERDGIRGMGGMHDRDGRMMRRILILMRNVLMRILVRRCRNVMKLLVLLELLILVGRRGMIGRGIWGMIRHVRRHLRLVDLGHDIVRR